MEVFYIWLVIILLWVLFMVRNAVTHHIRMKILFIDGPGGLKGIVLYEKLPTYDQMLWHPAYWAKWTTKEWLYYLGEEV
jgi:hypothetical protein